MEFFFCDEMFSHIHSAAEKAFLSVIIDLLHDDQQIFVTTHNAEILDMDRLFTDEELYVLFRDDESLLGRWNTLAQEAGFPEFTPSAEYLRESFAHLCNILRESGINTLSEVRKFIADMENNNKGLEQLRKVHDAFRDNNNWRVDPFSALFLLVLNAKWEDLKHKDLVKLNIKQGSDRISGQ